MSWFIGVTQPLSLLPLRLLTTSTSSRRSWGPSRRGRTSPSHSARGPPSRGGSASPLHSSPACGGPSTRWYFSLTLLIAQHRYPSGTSLDVWFRYLPKHTTTSSSADLVKSLIIRANSPFVGFGGICRPSSSIFCFSSSRVMLASPLGTEDWPTERFSWIRKVGSPLQTNCNCLHMFSACLAIGGGDRTKERRALGKDTLPDPRHGR